MTLLYLGIALWILVHLFKRVTPGARRALADALPKGADRGVISLLLLLSLVLIVVGYRRAEFVPLYDPFPGAGYVNNLLMYVTIVLFGMGSSKGSMRAWLRHPMLMGVVVWGMSHILVNGDLASVILFVSMIVWAIVQMVAINVTDPSWERPEPGPVKRNFVLLGIAAVLYGVIAGVHTALGRNPFLGSY